MADTMPMINLATERGKINTETGRKYRIGLVKKDGNIALRMFTDSGDAIADLLLITPSGRLKLLTGVDTGFGFSLDEQRRLTVVVDE